MHSCFVSYQQFVVLDDTEQLGPLAKALLPQQECTNPRVLDKIHGRLFWRPLVTHLLVLSILLFFIIGLVGAAHGIRVIIWKSITITIINKKARNSLHWSSCIGFNVIDSSVTHWRWYIRELFQDLKARPLHSSLLVERSWAEEVGRCLEAAKRTQVGYFD